MRRLVIDVDVGPLHVRQRLELHLQLLGDIVRLPQRALGVHHHVDLDHQARAAVPGAHGVDGDDVRRVGHADVGDELLGLGVGGDADEELELAVGGAEPEDGDEQGEDDGAHGVDPPAELGSADAGEDAEAVDHQVVAVVFPQDADLRVLVAQRPAVEEQT